MNESTPLALRPAQAAKALGISQRHLWALTKNGIIPAIRLGGGKRQITLYSVDALRDWLAQQTAAKEGGQE